MAYPRDSQGRPVITIEGAQREAAPVQVKAPSTGAFGQIVGGAVSTGAQFLGDWLNRRWQERMSNTAYQRQVADMRKAGLNPILAATKGGGASTPSGSSGDVSGLGSGISSAARLANIEKERLVSEIGLNSAATLARRSEAQRIDALRPLEADYIRAQTDERIQTAKTIQSEREMMEKGGGFAAKYLPRDLIQWFHQLWSGGGSQSSAKEGRR